jgi:L-ribulose-5-phosphate 4-epimerase
MGHEDIKKRVYDATLNLFHVGLIRLSAGNISARIDDHLAAITPAGRSYDILKAEDISIVSLDGNLVEGDYKPSSETPLHTAIYRELPEVGAVVHTHSIFAMTFAASEKPLLLLGVEALAAQSNGPIPVARYVSPGSSCSGEVVMEVFRANPGLQALLLRNHGLLAVGPDVETAWQTAYKIETAAQVAYQTYALGKPVELTSVQVQEIFEIYGIKK